MCLEAVKKIVDDKNIILLDIEGTTTSISFIKDVLFPYAEKFLESYVETHWNDDKMKEIVGTLIKEQGELKNSEGFIPLPPPPLDESEIIEYRKKIIAHLRWQQSKDFKSTGLKKIQGHIWMEGYFNKSVKGHVYEDVPKALKYWKDLGKKIYIYSSGSVEAQKLLFCMMCNLEEFIDGNFDTTIGSKLESGSYLKIAKELNEKPENIVFLTDRPKEVVAAKKSGMYVIRMVREDFNPFLKEENDLIGHEDATLESFSPIIRN